MSRVHSRQYIASRPDSGATDPGAADLDRLLDFVRRAAAARWPTRSYLHVGDVVWRLCPDARVRPEEDIRLWLRDDELIGFVWFDEPEHVEIDLLPGLGHEPDLADEMLRWAETRRLETGAANQWDPELEQEGSAPYLVVEALDRDATRIEWLEGHGYEKKQRHGVLLRRDPAVPVPKPDLPPGFSVRPSREMELEELAAAHCDAWEHLDDIGIVDAKSGLSAEWYRRLRRAPIYDPELDLTVATPDGELACCCLCWLDRANGIGFYEPVGTRLGWRRQGLARQMIFEGLRRLHARGARTVYMGTASINGPAIALYESCGFTLDDRCHWYAKRLQ